jgi:hypothetical protein
VSHIGSIAVISVVKQQKAYQTTVVNRRFPATIVWEGVKLITIASS